MIEIVSRTEFDISRRFVVVRRRGVLYDLGGEVIELFSLKVMAEALDRSRDTLLDWEARGFIPRPLFEIERRRRFHDDRAWRTYSGVQVVNANRLARLYFGERRRLNFASLAAFTSALRRCWSKNEIKSFRMADEGR